MNNKEINKIINNVKATLAIEGLEPSEFAQKIGIRYLKGDITSEEAIKLITENILRKKK